MRDKTIADDQVTMVRCQMQRVLVWLSHPLMSPSDGVLRSRHDAIMKL
jgi:hypothetical protein